MRTGTATGRPRRPSRAGVVAVLAWALAVVVGGAIASQALAAVDSPGRAGVLSESEVTAALLAASATASPEPTMPAPAPAADPAAPPTAAPATSEAPPAPTPTPLPTTAHTPPPVAPSTPASGGGTVPPAPAPPPTVVARTWTVPGGIVAVSCNGAAITLLYATPSDGWTVELGSTGPQHVEVQLQRDGAETKLTGTCVSGVPESRLDAEDDGSEKETGRRGSVQVPPSPEGDG